MTPFFYPGATIAERIAQIRQTLPATVRFIAVTKQVSVADMRQAYAAGVRDFGESRIQEAAEKQVQLQDLPDITWHLIGHLQSNKAQKALELFQWIHSVDSLKIAQRLDQLAASAGQNPSILLQTKIVPDPNKYGWSGINLLGDLAALNQLRHLNIQGLMVIPPWGLEESEISSIFNQAAALTRTIRQQNWSHLQMVQLSMGMSDDYLLAIESGSTMVRLGRILFGDRAA